MSLLPEDYESVKILKKTSKIYGGVGSLVVMVRSNSYDKGLQFTKDLAKKFKTLDFVRYVEYKNPLEVPAGIL